MSSPPSRKPRVAVVFGGRSTEHAISCVSAGSVLAAVDRERFDVVAVGISPEGRWVLAADDPSVLEISGRSLPAVAGGAEDGAVVALPPDPARRRLVVLESGQVPRELGAVDVVFPMLHGPYGEDGTIQGMLEMAGVPYVGSGVLASAVTMDKEYMKLVLAARGLPVGPYVVVRPHDRIDDVLGEVERLGFPVFVKPARGGSSLGISKVGHAKDLGAALVAARAHDPKVLVEKGIAGRELECGVLEGARGGAPEASVVAEVRVVSSEFYDFEAKYLDDSTEFDVPADIPDVLGKRVQDLACRAFEALSCEGLARVDFFYPTEGELLVNEVNTMPGFTPMSMFPRMWAASGVDYPSLVGRLLANALSRRPGLR